MLTGYLRHEPGHTASDGGRTPKVRRKPKADAAAAASPTTHSVEHRVQERAPAHADDASSRVAAKDPAERRADLGARRSEFPVRPDSDEI